MCPTRAPSRIPGKGYCPKTRAAHNHAAWLPCTRLSGEGVQVTLGSGQFVKPEVIQDGCSMAREESRRKPRVPPPPQGCDILDGGQ